MSPALRQTACDWCYAVGDGDEAAEFYRRLRKIGFIGIEMAEPGNWAAAEAVGLEIFDLEGPGMEWGLNRLEEHDAILPAIFDAIDGAAASGIENVVLFSGNRRGASDAEGIANCAAGLAIAAEHAERVNVGLLFEVLNSFDHVDYQADSARFVFEAVAAVGSPALRVMYDIYHVHRMGGDPIADLHRWADLIGHIHIAGSPRRDFPGAAQEIDYGAMVSTALAAGYQGAWGHEFIPSGSALDELERAFLLLERAAVNK